MAEGLLTYLHGPSARPGLIHLPYLGNKLIFARGFLHMFKEASGRYSLESEVSVISGPSDSGELSIGLKIMCYERSAVIDAVE